MVARYRVNLSDGGFRFDPGIFNPEKALTKYPEFPEAYSNVARFPRSFVMSLYESVFGRSPNTFHRDRNEIKMITNGELLKPPGQELFTDKEVRAIWRYRWMVNAGNPIKTLREPLSEIWLAHRELLYISITKEENNEDVKAA